MARSRRTRGRGAQRLVVVSNRLPFSFRRIAGGGRLPEPASGGLVTALLPVLRHRGGSWFGWPGTVAPRAELAPALGAASAAAGYTMVAVPLRAEQVRDFYLGFSNEIVWPLFHDMPSLCNFDPAYWSTYCQ